jgi:hypothetical protein
VPDTIYSVLCTDTAPYLQWQCELLEHTWREVRQPGELLRLVAAREDEALPGHAHARVLRMPPSNVEPGSGDTYAPYNRLHSLRAWLQREGPEGTVLILDPDMVFREALVLRTVPGAPVAQRWVDFGDGSWLAAQMGVERAQLQPATWPLAIHTQDLARLLRRWIERTADVRRVTGRWESDMFGLVLAASESGLRFELTTTCAWMNWPEDAVRGAPLLHYCQAVEAGDGTTLWTKRGYRPWDHDLDPTLARLDYCRDLLQIVRTYARLRSGDPGSAAPATRRPPRG